MNAGVRAVRMEFTKLVSLRAHVVVLALVPVIGLAVAVLLMAVLSTATGPGPDPAEVGSLGIMGANVARYVVIVLGVMVITTEYASATMDATLLAVPQRRRMLAAKAVVLTVAGGAAGAVGGLLVLVAGALLTGSWTAVPVAAVGLLGVQTALVAVLALGVGAALRSAVAGVCTLFAIFTVVPFLPIWPVGLLPYLPHAATAAVLDAADADPFGLSPLLAIGVTACWAALALLAGVAVLRSADIRQ